MNNVRNKSKEKVYKKKLLQFHLYSPIFKQHFLVAATYQTGIKASTKYLVFSYIV